MTPDEDVGTSEGWLSRLGGIGDIGERTDEPPPDELEALVLACLAKAAEDRPTSTQLLEQLKQLEGEEWARWERSEAREWWDDNRAELEKARDEITDELVETVIGRRHRKSQTPMPPVDDIAQLAVWK